MLPKKVLSRILTKVMMPTGQFYKYGNTFRLLWVRLNGSRRSIYY